MGSTFCTYYNQNICRSCMWLELPYSEQLLKKETLLKAALPFFKNLSLEVSVPSPQKQFRNKAKLSVTGTTERPIIGLLGSEKLDEGRELLSCPIHHPKLNEIIRDLPEWIRDYTLIPYQIEKQKGELKGVILFYSPLSSELYLRFVLRSKECVSRIKKMLPALLLKFPELKSVSANIQPIPHAILEGHEEIFITEQSFIRHQLGDLTFKLSPKAFVQTNVEVATKLYQTAANWIAEAKPNTMLELFCGQGPFSFFAAKSAQKIVGLEINLDAVTTANETAAELMLTHLQFQCIPVAAAKSAYQKTRADLVLVNPPRRGLGKEGVELILSDPPEHFIYSSCSVETLAKDLNILSTVYGIQKIQLFDLFPHTEHFETLVQLKRLK